MFDLLRETTIAGNDLLRVVGLCGALLLSFIVGHIGRMLLNRAAKKLDQQDQSMTSATCAAFGKAFVFICFVIGFSLVLRFLNLPTNLEDLRSIVTSVLITVAVGYTVFCLIEVVACGVMHLAAKTSNKLDDMLVPMVRKSLRICVVVLVLVQLAQTLSDKPITSILAGLGVGGLALALAAQDTVKNFFGSLVVLADRPFDIGDRIVIDGNDGVVEEVGFRSTRMRTLDGEQVTVANGEMANKAIRNVGRRPYIKRVGKIGITYDTSPSKVARAMEIIKEILADHEGCNPAFPPRVFFSDFGASSLDITFIYWYHPAEFWDYAAFTTHVNMQILEQFNAEGIEFAFPTRTVHVVDSAQSAIDS